MYVFYLQYRMTLLSQHADISIVLFIITYIISISTMYVVHMYSVQNGDDCHAVDH